MNAKEYCDKAKEHYRQGDYNSALECYNHAIDLQKEYDKKTTFEAYYGKGRALQSQGKYREAVIQYSTALEITPYKNDYKKPVKVELDDDEELDKSYDESSLEESQNRMKKHFDIALRYYGLESLDDDDLEVDNETIYSSRALCNESFGNYKDAIADYTTCIKIFTNKSHYYNRRGGAYEHSGDYTSALKDYTAAIDNSKSARMNRPLPSETRYYSSRANLYKKMGKKDLALDDFSRVLECDPPNWLDYFFRAEYYYELGKMRDADDDYRMALKLIKPGSDYDYVRRANIYEKIGEHNKALEDYNKAIEVYSSYGHRDRADYYFRTRNFNKAIDDYSFVLKLHEDIGALVSRAKCYEKTNREAAAMADYEIVANVQIDYRNTHMYHHRGFAREKLGMYKEALADYVTALKIDMSNKEAQEGIQRVKYHQKD